MHYYFEYEIKALDKAQCVENKLMIFSLYYDLFYDLVKQFDSIKTLYDVQDFNDYQLFLQNTLQKTLNSISYDNGIDNFEVFYQNVRKHDISRFWIMNDIINEHERSFLHKVNDMKYVSVLDNMNLDFQTSVKFLLIFKEHMRNIYVTMVNETYKYSSICKLCNFIMDELSFMLPSLIRNSQNFTLFSSNLKQETKKIISYKICKGEFDLFDFYDEIKFCYINLLDHTELDICRLRLIYVLSGYHLDSDEFKLFVQNEVYDKFQLSKEEYDEVVASVSQKFKNFEKSVNEGKILELKIK